MLVFLLLARIHFPILFTLATSFSYTAFLKTFLTTSLSLLKSTGTGANLSMSNLSTSVFRLAKFVLVQNLKYQHVFVKSVFAV